MVMGSLPGGTIAYLGDGRIRPVTKPPVQFQLAERHQLPVNPLHTTPKHGEATPNLRVGLGRALSVRLDLARLGKALENVLGPSIEAFLEVQGVGVCCFLGWPC